MMPELILLNLRHTDGFLDCMKEYEEKVVNIDKMIREKTGLGNDYLGWFDYPNTIDKNIEEFQT